MLFRSEIVFNPLYILTSFVKDKVSIGAWIYLWALFFYSSLENPMNSMNSMKRQKDRTLKDELPRSVGAQYATGDQWRNNSRKNERTEPKQKKKKKKKHPVLDVTSDGSKV